MSKTELESEWLAGAQLAKFLNVTTMTIWRWGRDAEIEFPQPTVIHGRKYWSRDDINAWMRRMTAGKGSRTGKVG